MQVSPSTMILIISDYANYFAHSIIKVENDKWSNDTYDQII